ncbi:unnamed protein product [Lymnaea stagnalis]|uniref:Uncharacterized protein n=1 Tax=Lymnaea stagnalis TaxID=6523 RepID=A0AAV2HZ66_LYMST
MVLDLNRIIMDAVADKLTTAKKNVYDLNTAMINTYFMCIETGETIYDKTGRTGKPSVDIVYSALFTNKTHTPQVYKLNTSRETTSVYEFTYSKCWSFGAEINMTGLIPVVGANLNAVVGLKHTRQKGNKVVSEHKITWGIDSKVAVPGKHWVMANLVITEEDYSGDFEMTTTFDGQVVVLLGKREKNILDRFEDAFNKHVYRVDFPAMVKEGYEEVRLNVRNIFTPKLGFVNDAQGRPTFKTKGECKCRIGVEQEIIISEFLGEPPKDNDPTFMSLEKEATRKAVKRADRDDDA